MSWGKLKQELETFESHKAELVGKAKGKYVLIKNTEIVDTFDTPIDAIKQGYKNFGNVPFLVKQIVEVEIPENFTSNLLRI